MANKLLNSRSYQLSIFGLLLLCFGISYRSLFWKLLHHWNGGDNSYCYLIVPLVIYLCWEKRKEFHFGQFSWNLLGLVPVLISVLLMIAGELGSMETLLYIGIWACIAGVMFVLYGLRLKHLAFSLLILAFLVPLPPFVNQVLTFNLKLSASTVSAILLRFAGVSVLQNGNVIDLGLTQLQVVDACSGLRYFMPLILMALLFGYFYGRRLWQKAFLLVLVLPLSIVVNGFRIFSTGMLYIWGYPELSKDLFHDFSGWLVFMMAGAILFLVSMLLRRIGSQEKPNPLKDPGGVNKGLKFQAAMTATLCLLFVSSGWAMQKLPSSMHFPSRSFFKSFPMRIGQWSARRNYLSDEILNALWADDYVSATYHRQGRSNTIHLLIPFYEYQATRHTAHAPQSCMLGSGWDMAKSEDRSVAVGDGEHIRMRVTLWKKGDYKICGAYFFMMRGRVITSPWANKAYLMLDAFTKRRTDGALVRMEMDMDPGQSFSDAQAVIEEFTAKLWPILPEYVPR